MCVSGVCYIWLGRRGWVDRCSLGHGGGWDSPGRIVERVPDGTRIYTGLARG